MQVYISWSGQMSYKLGLLVRDLIRKVTPDLEVWISAEDIQAGARWSTDLIQIIDEISFCIVCVDPSSCHSPWLSFELGAISKTIDKYNIRILYYEVKPSTVEGPVSQFSPILIDPNEFRRFFEDLQAVFPRRITSHFDTMSNLDEFWEDFDREVAEIPTVMAEPIEDQGKEEGATEAPEFFIGHVNETGKT